MSRRGLISEMDRMFLVSPAVVWWLWLSSYFWIEAVSSVDMDPCHLAQELRSHRIPEEDIDDCEILSIFFSSSGNIPYIDGKLLQILTSGNAVKNASFYNLCLFSESLGC